MVCPAATCVALGDVDGHHAGERRGDVVGVGLGRPSPRRGPRWRCCGRAPTTGRSWPLRMHITVRMPRSSGSEIASSPMSSSTPCVELRRGAPRRGADRRRTGWRDSREVSPYVSRCASNSFVGPGNSSRLSVAWRFAARLGRAASSSADELARPAWPAARPARALVRSGSGQPPGGSPSSPRRKPITESGMSNRAGSAANSSASTPGTDQCQREIADHLRRRRDLDQPAQHPVGGGVVALRPPRTGRRARARWPAGAGSTAGRRGSRGCTPARSARAARTRTARTPFAAPPSTAPGRTPPAGSARCRTRCARRRPRSRDSAGWLVVPASGAEAPSTASAPACQAAR